ncbi:hypothetical protein M378DRAFT_1056027 [Amanita muscaria Koide BX008]|uniref:Uncharacterized protein n=1 Tax=Amanita muscaria (strain Koide BX008) TaxID=946122 RepID=A0A0C2RW39_AMAMK|nr:hypothetical protein M378DRAFT_1056027 [Amanita muscaria Koide BX008]
MSGKVTALDTRYSEICETFIDASDLPGFVDCCQLHPHNLPFHLCASANSVSFQCFTLLPYLKNASSVSFQVCTYPIAADTFGTLDGGAYNVGLSTQGFSRINHAYAQDGSEVWSGASVGIVAHDIETIWWGRDKFHRTEVLPQMLQESVACMHCSATPSTRLVNLMKSCNGRIQQAIRKSKSQVFDANDVRALLLVVLITTLLVEHCDSDRLRSEDESLAPEIDSISKEHPLTTCYDLAYTSLIQLYLSLLTKAKSKNMEELVRNTDGFADSGCVCRVLKGKFQANPGAALVSHPAPYWKLRSQSMPSFKALQLIF